MNQEIEILWGNQTLLFHKERAIYFAEHKLLLISDLHLGKSGHFRKHGIAIPQSIAENDLYRLNELLKYFTPEKVVIAGDFFHAEKNNEIQLFEHFLKEYSNLQFILIKGNHDRFKNEFYTKIGFNSIANHMTLDDIVISHDFIPHEETYQITGHIHPGINLKNSLKQHMRLPVFAYHEKHIVLPAFSKFTGLYTKWENNDYEFIGCTDYGLVSL